jgi:hypothetical protein
MDIAEIDHGLCRFFSPVHCASLGVGAVERETSLPEIQIIVFAQQYWLRFAKIADNLLQIVLFFDASFSNLTDGAIPPSDSSGFVSIELKQLR